MPVDYIENANIAANSSSNILDTVASGAVAVGADTVATLFNSTFGLLGATDIKTEDLLSRVSKDALALYNEHPDTVHTLSFLSSMIAPQAVAIKILNGYKQGALVAGKTLALERTGVSGAVSDVFTGRKAVALQSELKAAFEAGAIDTKAYNTTMYKLYAAKIGENVIDGAIFETVAVGTLNAHPYMEDYMQNPYTNFVLWSGLFGAVGGALGAIGAKTAVRDAIGILDTEAHAAAQKAVIQPRLGASMSEVYQTETMTINNFEALLKSDVNEATKNIARNHLIVSQNAKETALLKAAPFLQPEKGKVNALLPLRPIVEEILANPNWKGINSISIPNLTSINKGTSTILEFAGKTPVRTAEGELQTVLYRHSTGEFFAKENVSAAAHAQDVKGMKLDASTVHFNEPGVDFAINQLARAMPSAYADAAFIVELKAWEKMQPQKIQHTGIAPDNLPRLTAAVNWASKQSQEIQDAVAFNVRSDLPTFNQTQKFITEGAAGVKADYVTKVKALSDDGNISIFGVLNRRAGKVLDESLDFTIQDVHSRATQLLNDWQGSSPGSLRRAFDAFFRGTALPIAETANKAAAKAIWEAGSEFRSALAKEADSEGFVYLYRGISRKITGHAPVEGYTINPKVAADFGTMQLFKIHIDNVIGRIGGSSFSREAEILVGSPHQQIVQAIPTGSLTAKTSEVIIPGAASKSTLSFTELKQLLTLGTERQVKDMVATGKFSFEEISARLNITKEAAMLVATDAPLASIPKWQRLANIDDVNQALKPESKMLSLSGNKHDSFIAQQKANLDQELVKNGSREVVALYTAASKSTLAHTLLDFLNPVASAEGAATMRANLDLIEQTIGQYNNNMIGSPLLQTIDNALRHTSAGPAITWIGKRLGDIKDAAVKELMEPARLAFKNFSSNETAVVEFSMVHNRLMSMSGWKDMMVEASTGYGYLVTKEVGKDGKEVLAKVLEKDGTPFYIKQKEVVAAIESLRAPGEELYRMHNLQRQIRSQAPLNDIGLYMTPVNLVGKHFSYVVDSLGVEKTSILLANSADELAGLEQSYKASVAVSKPNMQIVSRSNQKEFNVVHGYMEADPFITRADIALRHGGASALTTVPGDARLINSVMEGFESQIKGGMTKYSELYMHDVTHRLDFMSDYNQRFVSNQPLRGANVLKARDAAKAVKNTLLGRGNLELSSTWKNIDDHFDMMLSRTAHMVDDITRIFQKDLGSQEHFDRLLKDLNAKGVKPPWESLDVYQQNTLGGESVQSKRIVSALAGTLSTFTLRLADAAYIFANLASLPILGSGVLKEGLPATTMANGAKIHFPQSMLVDATRFGFTPEGRRLAVQWTKDKHLGQTVRQFTDSYGELHAAHISKDTTAKGIDMLNRFQESGFVKLFTHPADFTENLTRQFAMNLGYLMARRAYPGISEMGATIHAVTVADRIIGNYYSAQRPIMFQGTLGSAISLYQTYMLTFAQHVYRGIEAKAWGTLGTTMLAQAGVFGTASWPGYNLLSQFIGQHMSNTNYDLTTGTYRALNDPTAEAVLYGLPSMLTGSAFYSRGDVTPRIPTPNNLAILNGVVGAYQSIGHLINGLATQPGMAGKLQAMEEALSLQTISRPIARLSELASGESITSKGHTVNNSDQIWTFQGAFSRLMATRPLKEEVLRNANYLNSFYNTADNKARQEAAGKLRIALRAGSLPDGMIDDTARDYLQHGGTGRGWDSVMNNVMANTESGISYELMRKLEPTSPLRRMVNSTF